MNRPTYQVTYIYNGQKITSRAAENEHYKIEAEQGKESFKAKICPKDKIELVRVDAEFAYQYDRSDRFFGNGYQAWTTSKEYARWDKMRDIIPIAVGPLKNLAGISADTRFVKCPEKAGEFYSHTYTYIRNGKDVFLVGSLTERQGFTVIYADMNRNTLTISKDVEGVTISEPYELYDIVTFAGTYDGVFDRYFAAMKIGKPRLDHMSGYTSWYNYFQNIDQKIILRDLNALNVVKDSVSIFQIDDGYETFVGDWLDSNPEKFPKGMKYVADEVHKKGYKAGIWIAPFNLQIKSRMYKEHPDWVIKDEKGKPILGVFAWGGAYTMDMYNSDAREYMRSFFDVILNDWGYDMVKLDFLYSQCMIPRYNKSRGTIMVEAMEFLRECVGDKLILGCGVPLGAAFGYVDACRIGCDVDLDYGGVYYNKLHVNNEIPSAQNSINNAVFRRHLNGRAFCNDPDVFFLRYSNLKFNTKQKLLLGGINHLFGDVLFVSDNVEEYHHDDITAVKKFFSKSDASILSAEYILPGVLAIELIVNGKKEKITVDMKSGKSNMAKVLGLSDKRYGK